MYPYGVFKKNSDPPLQIETKTGEEFFAAVGLPSNCKSTSPLSNNVGRMLISRSTQLNWFKHLLLQDDFMQQLPVVMYIYQPTNVEAGSATEMSGNNTTLRRK